MLVIQFVASLHCMSYSDDATIFLHVACAQL